MKKYCKKDYGTVRTHTHTQTLTLLQSGFWRLLQFTGGVFYWWLIPVFWGQRWKIKEEAADLPAGREKRQTRERQSAEKKGIKQRLWWTVGVFWEVLIKAAHVPPFPTPHHQHPLCVFSLHSCERPATTPFKGVDKTYDLSPRSSPLAPLPWLKSGCWTGQPSSGIL